MDTQDNTTKETMDSQDTPTFASKFSSIEDVTSEDRAVYQELERFVYYLAWTSDGSNILMEVEEVAAELLAELVKGMKHYSNLPREQRKAVIRRMLDNRMGELRHRFFGTHRRAAKLSVSIEMDETIESVSSDELKPEDALTSQERVQATRNRLSEPGRRVFDAVIYGNARLEHIMRLSALRSNQVFANPVHELKCWHVAEALLMSVDQVAQAFDEIKVAYAEVVNGR